MKKSDYTAEELENMLIQSELKVRKTKDILKEISKFINKEIKKL